MKQIYGIPTILWSPSGNDHGSPKGLGKSAPCLQYHTTGATMKDIGSTNDAACR